MFSKPDRCLSVGRRSDTQEAKKNCTKITIKISMWGFPGGAVVENPPANARDTGWIPGPGRSHMSQSN